MVLTAQLTSQAFFFTFIWSKILLTDHNKSAATLDYLTLNFKVLILFCLFFNLFISF